MVAKILKSKKTVRIMAIVLSVLMLLTAISVIISLTRATVGVTTYDITYSSGQYRKVTDTNDGEVVNTGLFADFTVEDRQATASKTLILPGTKFSENLDGRVLSKTGDAKLDGETFYFDTLAEGEAYADKWAYTFTGWKIQAADEKIPGETVFQPGDVIRPEVLKKYAADGSLELEALWARCYFIRNPYQNMVYAATKNVYKIDKNNKRTSYTLFELQIPEGVTPLSSDENAGNDPKRPKATIDGLYEDIRKELGNNYTEQRANSLVHDAYSRAVVLVGELDYYTDSQQPETKYYGYKNEYDETGKALPCPTKDNVVPVSATYKSLGDTAFTYNYKPRNYSNTVYGNLRFDNVNFCKKEEKWNSQDNGVEFQITDTAGLTPEDSYIEFTARYNASMPSGRNTAISTFRPSDVTYVVVNGGVFNGMQNQYSSPIETGKQLYWTVGRNADIANLNCGTTSAYTTACHNIYYDYKVYFLGGQVDNVYGGSNGINTISLGKREFFLYGDGTVNLGGSSGKQVYAYDPNIANLYGGSSESRLFGDIYIEGYSCTKLGNVYGGGRDYSATTFGNIDIQLKDCELSGDVYGGGKYGNCELTPGTYIQYETIKDSITKEEIVINNNNPIANLDANIPNIKIDNKNLAQRNAERIGGDVSVKLIDTDVKGNVFGSGMGQSQILEVRNQMQAEENEWWLASGLPGENGTIDNANENAIPTDDQTWKSPIQGYPTYNRVDNRVLVNAWRDGTYTTNAANIVSYYNWHALASLSLATVQNVDITIQSGSVIGTSGGNKGNVYGGGSIAKVLGDTKITITDSTVYGDVYGGGDGVTIPDQVKVYWPEDHDIYKAGGDLYDATLPAYVSPYYTGTINNITWHKQTPNPDNRKNTNAENKGNYKQYKLYTWSNDPALIDPAREDYGIDHEQLLLYSPNTQGLGSVEGNTSVTVNGNSVMYGNVYGGGNQGMVFGDTHVTVEGNTKVGVWKQKEVQLPDGTKEPKWVCDSPDGSGQVFGGGNGDASKNQTELLGAVYGDSYLTIDGNCLVHEAYGGCNAADVRERTDEDNALTGESAYSTAGGNVNLLIKGGTVDSGFGGNNEKGNITGAIHAELTSEGKVIHQLFGGGNKADYAGVTNLVISGGHVGIPDTPQESTGTVVGCAYGGGKEASVYGTKTVISGGEIRAFIGGSYNADIKDPNFNPDETEYGYRDAVTVYVTGENLTKITTFMGGNDFGGNIEGNIRLVLGRTEDNLFVAGTDDEGNPTEYINVADRVPNGNIKITNFFGGGNQAPYTYGAEWELPTENPGYAQRIKDYQGITVTAVNCDVYQLFGGGVMADITNVRVALYGGEYNFVYGGGYKGAARSCGTHIRGGTVNGDWLPQGQAGDPTALQGGYIFGGGYMGYTEHSIVYVEELTAEIGDDDVNIVHSVFGGGNKADVGNSKVLVMSGEIRGSVYGGGFEGDACVDRDGNVIDGAASAVELYGGIIGSGMPPMSDPDGEKILGNVYGGGYKGVSHNAHVDIVAYHNDEHTTNLTLHGDVFGGGHDADIDGDTHIHFLTGSISGNIYGGGRNGHVTNGGTYVDVLAGTIGGSVYGGGYKGRTQNTHILISDKQTTIEELGNEILTNAYEAVRATEGTDHIITIGDSVFGGGYGMEATVLGDTTVRIDTEFAFEKIEETPTETGSNTSAEIETTVKYTEGKYSCISGSVYGGGDFGQIGEGVINQGNNTAQINTIGKTKVILDSGHVQGSVFGGGNGVPRDGVVYTVYTGAVFGNTTVNINNGLVEGNIYGGGKQARLFGDSQSDYAAHLVVKETADSRIAIGGSVFGGGDRGNGATTNASIPTTVGDVKVEIRNDSGRTSSQIYFYKAGGTDGGIYGEGNLCLVKGNREVYIKDFTIAGEGRLKTFYSLQRADSVTLDNSDVVLLGAVDLVEEGDITRYSINRVSNLYLTNGSTVKLTEIVKGLGGLYSDICTDTVYIDKGHNGSNGWTTYGGVNPADKLTDEQINSYIAGTYVTNDRKNTVCVANGLYLEVLNSNGEYGPVKGLFTLELLYATPGEGGGFVYGNKLTSTGDFICETRRGYVYTFEDFSQYGEEAPQKFAEAYAAANGMYFVRSAGGVYTKVESASEYSASEMYYLGAESDAYMAVVDELSGWEKNDYTYYMWYINGPVIKYNTDVTGYIGSSEQSFSTVKRIPQTVKSLNYALFAIDGGEYLASQIFGAEKKYDLVQASSGLTEQQIAIELKLGENSLGFLYYDTVNSRWGIQKGGTTTVVYGYNGDMSELARDDYDFLREAFVSSQDTSYVTAILHKSVDVDAERENMNIIIDISLFEGRTPYADGASTLIFNTTVNIKRLVPIQDLYAKAEKAFEGVIIPSNNINITSFSSLTADYTTKYIPAAFPNTNGNSLSWVLSTKCYTYAMNKDTGIYFTLDEESGVLINGSKNLRYNHANLEAPVLGANGLPADHEDDNRIFKVGDTYKVYTQIGDGLTLVEFDTVHQREGSKLPENTKIIMIDYSDGLENPEYFYYICGDDTREIDLINFMYMATGETIAEANNRNEYPPFMDIYNKQAAVRSTERLLFTLDFSLVDVDAAAGSSELFSGVINLKHLYGVGGDALDFMDYVETNTTETTVENKRAFPLSTEYLVNADENENGLKDYTPNFEKTQYYDIDTSVLKVSFDESDNWINTQFREGDYSLKVELVIPPSSRAAAEYEPIPFPIGMNFKFNGQSYVPGNERKYVIIPVNSEGSYEIEIENLLYSLKDVLEENDEKARFRVTLYSSPDSRYFQHLTSGMQKIIEFEILDNPVYSLKVVAPTDQQISAGQNFSFTVETAAENEGVAPKDVSVNLMLKNREGKYENVSWRDVFEGESLESFTAVDEISKTLKTLSTAESGTYRLVFTYGGHTEYLNFIIQ